MADRPSEDAELLRLNRELDAAWARKRAELDASGPGDSERADSAIDGVCAAAGSIVERIAELQAETLAGLGVKAKALAYCQCVDVERPDVQGTTTEDRIEFTIKRDLVAMWQD